MKKTVFLLLFISIVILYILHAFFINDKKSKFFLITLILIVLVDILILGFYFGSEKLLQRYLFLQNDIIEYLPSAEQSFLSRGDIVKFALVVSKKFVFWGYGSGGFEYLEKIRNKKKSPIAISNWGF